MAWRYINPGYVHLLDKNAQSTATQVTGYEYSKTGVAFYQTSEATGITLPDFAHGDDFWARFDCYIPLSNSFSVGVYAPYNYKKGIYMNKSGSDFRISVWSGSSIDKRAVETSWGNAGLYGIKKGAINTILIHVDYDTGAGYLIEVTINDITTVITASSSSNVFAYDSSYKPVGLSTYSSSPVSNIIFSNEEINIKEQVVALPVSSTETAMTLQSDTYLADSAGQTLLQSVNVISLISDFGNDSKVTGIALVGNPAYRTGEQLSSLTAISKSGGTVTEYGTSNLDTDSDTVIWQGVPVASDTTIADLQNIQLGWKAGEWKR